MKVPKIDITPHNQITMYIVMWILIAVVIIVFFTVSGFSKKAVTCIDGTVTTEPSSCPQCLLNEDCGVDKECRSGKCSAKPCIYDEDCDLETNECVYGYCTKLYDSSTNLPPGGFDEE